MEEFIEISFIWDISSSLPFFCEPFSFQQVPSCISRQYGYIAQFYLKSMLAAKLYSVLFSLCYFCKVNITWFFDANIQSYRTINGVSELIPLSTCSHPGNLTFLQLHRCSPSRSSQSVFFISVMRNTVYQLFSSTIVRRLLQVAIPYEKLMWRPILLVFLVQNVQAYVEIL